MRSLLSLVDQRREAHDVVFDIRRFLNERRALPETTRVAVWASRPFDNGGDGSAGLLVCVEPAGGRAITSPLKNLDELPRGVIRQHFALPRHRMTASCHRAQLKAQLTVWQRWTVADAAVTQINKYNDTFSSNPVCLRQFDNAAIVLWLSSALRGA
jgi:hypothetical protein